MSEKTEKMKTPLKELCDRLYKTFKRHEASYFRLLENKDADIRNVEKFKGKMYGARDAWKEATTFLTKEKQVIIEAFNKVPGIKHNRGEQYYNENFEQ